MSYVALYRRYRPITYSEVMGQSAVIKVLKNQVITDKVSHAYIFSGTRGTGKTTMAKIFARAVNCLNPIDGEPCGKCEACISILDGSATDVIEMDAASNNSVENIRSIRQEVMYATTGLKYKVYIIDEAHMLSPGAFNALLKTLEEPPKGVIFILATTEEHKILPTILSRCIRFRFKKLTEEEITTKLVEVLNDLKVEYDEDSLKYISMLADGALRDALSILERCIEENTKISLEQVKIIAGDTDSDIINSIVKSILEYNVENVESSCKNAIKCGKELRYINSKVIEKFLDIMVAVSTNNFDAIDEDLKKLATTTGKNRISFAIKELSALDDALRQGINNQIIFRAKLIEITANKVSETPKDIENIVKALELEVEELKQKLNNINRTSLLIDKEKEDKQLVEIIKKEEKDKEEEIKKDDIEKQVLNKEKGKDKDKNKEKENKAILDKIMKHAVDSDRLKLYSALSASKIVDEDNIYRFVFNNDFAYSVAKLPNEATYLEETMKEIVNKDINVLIQKEEEKKNEEATDFERIIMESGINYEKID